MNKSEITYEELLQIQEKLEIRIGTIVSAIRIPKSKKLLELYVGLTLPFITNLFPSKIMGVESQAMIVVGETTDGRIELRNYSIGTKLI